MNSLNEELFLAASQLQYRIVKNLIVAGADANYQNEKNTTPLLVAITDDNKKKSLKTVQVLVENGANVNLAGRETLGKGYFNTSLYEEKDTYSPLMLAARCGNYDVVEFLVKKGADVNYKSFQGDNALIYASENAAYPPIDEDAEKILKLLIFHKAKINHQGRHGKTALHYACESSELFPAKILFENGADPTIKDKDGITPLCLAKNNDHKKIEELLNNCITKSSLSQLITVTVDEPENLFM